MKKAARKPLSRIFYYFRRILDLNNQLLEQIGNAERVLGGNYVFDRTFLREFVTSVCEITREVIYNLNALTNGAHMVLYDRLEDIRFTLEDIVAGGPGPFGNRLTLSYQEITRDLDEIVGSKNANLADIHNNFKVRIPAGFAITARAYQLFLEENSIVPKIEDIYRDTDDPDRIKEQIRQAFRSAAVPEMLARHVKKELQELIEELGRVPLLAVRSSAVGEDGERSFAGQFKTVLNVKPEDLLEAYKEVIMARFMPEVMDYLGRNSRLDSNPVAVGVQEMIDASIAGVAYTRDPLNRCKDCIVITAAEGLGDDLVAGHLDGDHYMVRRSFPFCLQSSFITTKPLCKRLPTGDRPLDMGRLNMRRGSSLLDIQSLKAISEVAMLCEKAFGTPRDIEWALDGRGELVLLQNRRLGIQAVSEPLHEDLEKIVKRFPVLLDGVGHTAQFGAASGRVVHVEPDDNMDEVPVGAIVVAKYAHPRLSRVLRRAGAIVTDIGSSTGHLATIAREYRVPAIFGTGKATQILEEGMEVTVDADNRRVYQGIIEELVEVEAKQDWQYMEEPEIKTLRRVLSHVAPLYLTDPASGQFTADRCKTVHDIIHFAHVKAVDSLIEQFSSARSIKDERTFRLQADLPIEILIVDIGGGLRVQGNERDVRADQVCSAPFKAILSGLLRRDAWDKEPAPFGLGDLFSSMVRPVSMLTHPPEFSGRNLAIVAQDYMNLSLLLGYHFNVIDSFMSEEPDNNYIYFRFAGGFAEEEKRLKRAELIRWILETLGFKTEVRKDIVIGKLKGLDSHKLSKILEHLGWLIAFTRQLDVRMADDRAVERFYNCFLDMCSGTL